MGKIFISYRHEDAGDAAGRLKDNLSEEFGPDSIFIDVDDIALGRDFRVVIEETLSQCGVLLAVMGKTWLQNTDQKGRRRLDQPGDFVRLEIGTALKRDIPVIPVCVQGAGVPDSDDLPDDLKDFAFRNAFELTHARWHSDVQLLIEKLRSYMGDPGRSSNCLNGTWRDFGGDPGASFTWIFSVSGTSLIIHRTDEWITGKFKASGDIWKGELQGGGVGGIWKNVVLTPNADCSLVDASKDGYRVWSYKRTDEIPNLK